MTLTNILKKQRAQSPLQIITFLRKPKFVTGQAIVEYIVIFTVIGVFCLGMVAGLMTDNPDSETTHPGAIRGLKLRNVFAQAINSAINRINN